MTALQWVYDNAGSQVEYRGSLVANSEVRAIALARAVPYAAVYADLYRRRKEWIVGKEREKAGNRRVYARSNRALREAIPRPVYEPYLIEHGFIWHPPENGSAPMDAVELPRGRLVVVLRFGLTAVIDHIIYDVYDTSGHKARQYGYYRAGAQSR